MTYFHVLWNHGAVLVENFVNIFHKTPVTSTLSFSPSPCQSCDSTGLMHGCVEASAITMTPLTVFEWSIHCHNGLKTSTAWWWHHTSGFLSMLTHAVVNCCSWWLTSSWRTNKHLETVIEACFLITRVCSFRIIKFIVFFASHTWIWFVASSSAQEAAGKGPVEVWSLSSSQFSFSSHRVEHFQAASSSRLTVRKLVPNLRGKARWSRTCIWEEGEQTGTKCPLLFTCSHLLLFVFYVFEDVNLY